MAATNPGKFGGPLAKQIIGTRKPDAPGFTPPAGPPKAMVLGTAMHMAKRMAGKGKK